MLVKDFLLGYIKGFYTKSRKTKYGLFIYGKNNVYTFISEWDLQKFPYNPKVRKFIFGMLDTFKDKIIQNELKRGVK
jgi:hypothetical protein